MLFYEYFFQFNRMDETHFKLLKKNPYTYSNFCAYSQISFSVPLQNLQGRGHYSWDHVDLLFKNFLIAVYDNNLEKHKHVSAISIFLEFVQGLFHSGTCMQALVFPYVFMKHTRVSR